MLTIEVQTIHIFIITKSCMFVEKNINIYNTYYCFHLTFYHVNTEHKNDTVKNRNSLFEYYIIT